MILKGLKYITGAHHASIVLFVAGHFQNTIRPLVSDPPMTALFRLMRSSRSSSYDVVVGKDFGDFGSLARAVIVEHPMCVKCLLSRSRPGIFEWMRDSKRLQSDKADGFWTLTAALWRNLVLKTSAYEILKLRAGAGAQADVILTTCAHDVNIM